MSSRARHSSFSTASRVTFTRSVQAANGYTWRQGVAIATATLGTASGGNGTYALSSVTPPLSAGLAIAFSGATLQITGTPTVVGASTLHTIIVTDTSHSVPDTMTTVEVRISVVVASINQAVQPWTQNVAITSFIPVLGSGGQPPYTYGIAPILPSGMSIASPTGSISGTPTVAASSTLFSITVTDSIGGTGGSAVNSFSASVTASGPNWTNITNVTVPLTQDFSIDLPANYSTGYNPSTDDVVLNASSVALPSGWSMSTTGVLSFNHLLGVAGVTPNVIAEFKPKAAVDDWISISTTDGMTIADRLETNTKLVASGSTVSANAWVLNNGLQNNITLDTTQKVPGAAGSWRTAVLNTAGSGTGDIGVYFGDRHLFTAGEIVWWSFRQYAPPQQRYQPWPSTTNAGSKFSIMSHSSGSNQPFELVFQDLFNGGILAGYHQDGNSFPPEQAGIATNCSASDITQQGSIDRGANTLTGNNPDAGVSWSPCEQDRARYGLLSSATNGAADYRAGFGDPITGSFRNYANEWITFMGRCIIGSSGVANSRYTMWAARAPNGVVQPPIKIFDSVGITLGGSPAPQYNTLWLLPYCTNRQPGGRNIASRTNNIAGVLIHVCGLSTPIGNGTLEWNPTTGRFRWAGVSESFGTARGHSVANNKLILNVTSGTTAASYVVIEVTNAALLPVVLTTDTVTIADGRPDTYVNVNDVRVSSKVLLFPGGYAPINTYSTTFQATENPISEGFLWRRNASGVDQTNVMTETLSGVHVAHGTQSGHAAPPYDDSTTHMPDFGANYEVEATIWMAASQSSGSGIFKEFEILLHWLDTYATYDPGGGFGTTNIKGYEVSVAWNGAYANCGRYKGANLVGLGNGSGVGSVGFTPATGDKFRARIEGQRIRMWWNNVLKMDFTDNDVSLGVTVGDPGIGFWANGCPSNQIGYSALTITRL